MATLSQRFALQLAWLAQWIEHCVQPMERSGFDSQSSLNFFQVISFFFHTLVVHSTVTIMFTFLDNLIRKTDVCCRQTWNLVQKIQREIDPRVCDLTAAEIGEKGKTESCPNHCTSLSPSHSLGISHLANNPTPQYPPSKSQLWLHGAMFNRLGLTGCKINKSTNWSRQESV